MTTTTTTSTRCFSLIIPERLRGNKWILGPFWGRSELWRAQSGPKIHWESISDTPKASKWLQKLVQDRFLTHVGPQILEDSGMINKIYWVLLLVRRFTKKWRKNSNFSKKNGTDLGWFGDDFGMVWGYFRDGFGPISKSRKNESSELNN